MSRATGSPSGTTTKRYPAAILFRKSEGHGWWIAWVHEYYLSSMVDEGWTVIVSDSQIRDDDIAHTRALDTFKWGLGTRERR